MTVDRSDNQVIKVASIMVGPRGDIDLWLKAGKADGLRLCQLRAGPENADFTVIQKVEIEAFEKEILDLRRRKTPGIRLLEPPAAPVAADKEVLPE